MTKPKRLSYKYWASKQFKVALDEAIAEALLHVTAEGAASSGWIKQGPLDIAYQRVWETVSLHTGEMALKGVTGQSDIVPDMWKQRAKKYVETNLKWRKRVVWENTKKGYREAVDKAILRARDEGLGVEATQRRIRKLAFEETQKVNIMRARRIAQTELIASGNYGNYQGMLEAYNQGANIKKQWRVTYSGKNPRHGPMGMHGQSREMTQPFDVGGDQMQHPGDSSLGATAANTINCHCNLIAIANDTIEY